MPSTSADSANVAWGPLLEQLDPVCDALEACCIALVMSNALAMRAVTCGSHLIISIGMRGTAGDGSCSAACHVSWRCEGLLLVATASGNQLACAIWLRKRQLGAAITCVNSQGSCTCAAGQVQPGRSEILRSAPFAIAPSREEEPHVPILALRSVPHF